MATAFTVQIPWGEASARVVWPAAEVNRDYLLMVVAVLGTTISPYLFFWQASQEVEDMKQNRPRRPLKERQPLKELLRGGRSEIDRIALDTKVGMVFSNVIAFFIIVTTAAVLNASGVDTNIRSAAEAAGALRPLAGDLTFVMFALRDRRDGTARGAGACRLGGVLRCRGVWLACYAGGESTGRRRISQHHCGRHSGGTGARLCADRSYPNIDLECGAQRHCSCSDHEAVMMVVVTRLSVMGQFSARPTLTFFGWAGTALMAITVVALLWSSIG